MKDPKGNSRINGIHIPAADGIIRKTESRCSDRKFILSEDPLIQKNAEL